VTRLAAVVLLVLPGLASAAELTVVPATVPLVGPHASQRLLVLDAAAGRATADHTADATFTSSNPAVATVDSAGVVRAAGDGTATITATVHGRSATATITATKAKSPDVPDFRNHIEPVLTRAGCASGACHGALAGKGGMKLSLRGFDPAADQFVLTRQANARRVDRTTPEQSLVLLKATRTLSHGGGRRFESDSEEYRRLRDWIAAGAPAPKPDAPTLQRLELFPPTAIAKPHDKLRVIVRGWYSDGHAEDVTAWAKFSSSEEQVAQVDEDGRVTVMGTGEASVSVWYANHVATAAVTVPRETAVDPKLYADSPRANFVDEHVLRKLEALHIPPAGPCTDHEFIRRAFLDCTGSLPRPEDVAAFIADARPDRRARLIDALMDRPEFVDYWSYKWSDVLLVSSHKMQPPAMWAYYRWVRRAVAENRPWDKFARDLLTVQGSSLDNGAATYFVLHKDPAELSETTALTFLGMSVACAKCHNHPLEKWTQDQYWALANMFGRVGLKNGDRAGDVTVQSLPAGEVAHLRMGVPMPPAPLDAPPLKFDDPRDRRAVFADWLTSPDNPYFAKALVNRVWRNFLGRGLVEAEDDQRATNPPTNPELLDALARDFVADGYDVKHLIRVIMNSATYQRSSVPATGAEGDDRFYSHYLVRRLPAEVILDAYSQVTGVPTPFDTLRTGAGQVAVVPTGLYPRGVRAQQLPDVHLVSRFLDAFGRPERAQTCSCERTQDGSVTQALHLNNGQTLNDKLRAKESLVSRWLAGKVSDGDVISDLFDRALSRPPTSAERAKLAALLADAAKGGAARRETLEDLAWGVLTGREFLFNH
jgi:Protein of unknown function (DUF1553)/Protein of unknown function (DUF1549)/Bacterial Ig-like domain (group 2)